VEESRKSSESDETSNSSVRDSSSDEDRSPAKKMSPAYHDSDQSASSVCPALSTASSEGAATVLRRSLRKIIEESKRDAASSSVSNSRESTPPRTMSGSRRPTSSRLLYSPASSGRCSKSLGTGSGRGGGGSFGATRVGEEPDPQRRSARVRRLKRNADAVKSSLLPSGSIASSEDDEVSVKGSGKVCGSVSDVSVMTDGKRCPVDTSDTDSRASSLCAYNTRRSRAVQAKLTSRTAASARQNVAAKRSRVFRCVADELAKLPSSDSETDGPTDALRNPFFDSFLPDNSSNASSACSSVPAGPELSVDSGVDNCKNDVDRSSCKKETSAVGPDPDGSDLGPEFDTKQENWEGSEVNAKSPLSGFKESVSSEVPSGLESKVTCFEKENGHVDKSDDGVSNKVGECRIDSTRSAIEDEVVEANQEASMAVNRGRPETGEEESTGKECASDELCVTGRTEDEEQKAVASSKVGTGEEQDVDEKFHEEADDMANVKEEPPEILVCSYPAIYIISVSENITFPGTSVKPLDLWTLILVSSAALCFLGEYSRVHKSPVFLKPNPVGFLGFIGFWGFIGGFWTSRKK